MKVHTPRPESHATAAVPPQVSTQAMVICAAHWVGVQSRVPNSVTLPGSLMLQPAWNSAPKRSEERRLGKACVSTCRSRWSPYPTHKQDLRDHRIQKPHT